MPKKYTYSFSRKLTDISTRLTDIMIRVPIATLTKLCKRMDKYIMWIITFGVGTRV